MKEQLQNAMKDAMRAKDRVRLDAIRTILAAVQYEEMEKKVEPLPADGVLAVLQRELKKRKEEVEFAQQANRADLKEKLAIEIALIEKFLPQQMSASALESLLAQFKANTAGSNMGTAMKMLKEKHAGQYDSKMASEIAKKIFG
ncbi:MAG: GatB/YqeY domain-containing protein [Oligoflexia bacterium]|nr:GatB/YqeY domain-containing protein [Oligoflexia bacterium]